MYLNLLKIWLDRLAVNSLFVSYSSQCTKPLWKKSSVAINQDLQKTFYVSALKPAITPSTVVMGSKIKQMAAIPGWSSLETPTTKSVTVVTKPNKMDLTMSCTTANESLLVASTQTAVMLAELATDGSPADATLNITVDGRANQSLSRGHLEVKGHEKMDVTFVEEESGFIAPNVSL